MMDCSLFRQLRRNESFCWSFKSIFELVVSIEKLNKYVLQNGQFSLHYIEFETSSFEVKSVKIKCLMSLTSCEVKKGFHSCYR